MLIKLAILVLFISASVNCQSYAKGGRFEQQVDNREQQPVNQQYQDQEGVAPNSVEEPEGAPEPPAVVPQTSFTCEDKPYNPGMYADMEVGCTVYHMCFNGRKESFLCGTGTVFNQEILSCDHPVNVDCNASPSFYVANEELGKPGAEGGSAGAAPVAPAPAPAPQRRQPVPRPIPQAPVQIPQAPAPIYRPVQQVAPRPVPRPSKTIAPRPRPVPIPAPQRRQPVPRPIPQAPVQIPQAPAPIYRPVPQVAPRPVPRPSKTAVPRPRPVPAPRPIVQTTNEDDYGYEPSDVYYQEVPARTVNYKSSNKQRRRWAEYRS